MSCVYCHLEAKFEEKDNPDVQFCSTACQSSYYKITGELIERIKNDVDDVALGIPQKGKDVISTVGIYESYTLYLGAPQLKNPLIALNIKTIIAFKEFEPDQYVKEYLAKHYQVRYFHIPVMDSSPETAYEKNVLMQKLALGAEYITNGLRTGNVYVHCDAGQNRSVALVVYWLVLNNLAENVNDAYAYLVYRRPFISAKTNKKPYNFREFLLTLFPTNNKKAKIGSLHFTSRNAIAKVLQ